MQNAIQIGHPNWLHSMFFDEMHRVVGHCFNRFPHDLAKERAAEIRRWVLLVEQHRAGEEELKRSMTERRRMVLHDKPILLFRALLKDAQHTDEGLVNNLVGRFGLTGSCLAPTPSRLTFDRRRCPVLS